MKVADIELEARGVLLGLGFNESSLDKPFESLSGGWRMRCMLAGTLIQDADIMILDEPTNFLDLLGVIWLENYLIRTRDRSAEKLYMLSIEKSDVDSYGV